MTLSVASHVHPESAIATTSRPLTDATLCLCLCQVIMKRGSKVRRCCLALLVRACVFDCCCSFKQLCFLVCVVSAASDSGMSHSLSIECTQGIWKADQPKDMPGIVWWGAPPCPTCFSGIFFVRYQKQCFLYDLDIHNSFMILT